MNYNLTIEDEILGFKKTIPKEYPKDLGECMQILANLNYKSYGFPIVMHYYNSMGWWDISFRNPANFCNPDIKAISPLDACHKMFDFLLNLKQ